MSRRVGDKPKRVLDAEIWEQAAPFRNMDQSQLGDAVGRAAGDVHALGNPHFMTAIAASSLTLCAFLAIGRTRLTRDIALISVILVLLSYLILSQPVRAVIASVIGESSYLAGPRTTPAHETTACVLQAVVLSRNRSYIASGFIGREVFGHGG